jgi:hypothetical protein
MSEHRMAAIFYVRLADEATPPSVEDLATRAGLERIHAERGTVPAIYGQWGVMESVRAVRQILASHVCLQLFPHLRDLLDRQGNDAADSIPIAEAFRGACEALRPDAALLYTRPDEVEPEYVDAQYPKVLGLDGILLDESNPALLYLDTELAQHFPAAYRTGRDSLPVSHGLLLFRGTGARRWW